MSKRTTYALKVLTLIQLTSGKLIGPDEQLSKQLTQKEQHDIRLAMYNEFHCGNIPQSADTPRRIASWLQQVRSQGRENVEHEDLLGASLAQHELTTPFRAAAAA